MTDAVDDTGLLAAVRALRDAVEQAALPLDLPGAEDARTSQASLLKQLDDYVIPRLEALDAPLLAVVGGSTGAGKSTLVNSLVGQRSRAAGCCGPPPARPCWSTTPRTPAGSAGPGSCPGLARRTGAATPSVEPRRTTRPRSASCRPRRCTPGWPLLDAPDIDSVVRANRDLATQLLSAADLWLFVTTAARYADAVPWELLREAADAGHVGGDRAGPRAAGGDGGDPQPPRLDAARAGACRRAVVHGARDAAGRRGQLPDGDVARLRSWLAALARDARARGDRHTAHPHRRPGLPDRAGGGPRRGQRGAGAGRRGPVGGGRLRVRRRRRGRRGRHDRRQPAARRGARALAGVRRHGGVPAPGRGRRRPAARPRHRCDQGEPASRRGPR